ncbi:MAG: PTS sugar transporter subunit IIC, partial [Clostridia bacterium]|nr:PTS sugar transporter subunit IIC [Clostridia bacterium]
METQAVKTSWLKKYANRYFVDALGSMAKGLFATLLVGTIISAVAMLLGMLLPAEGELTFLQKALAAIVAFLNAVASVAKNNYVVGAAIGIAIAQGMKASPLVLFSAAVTGAIGYCAGVGENAIGFVASDVNVIAGPIGAYFASIVGVELGQLVSGK